MNKEANDGALAVVPRENMTALQVVGNMNGIESLGKTLAKSGFFGNVSEAVAVSAVVNCVMEGLSPIKYKAKYHTFDNGQTGVKSDYLQREFHRLGGTWKFVAWTPEKCDMVFTYQGETLPFCVTIDEMKENGVAVGKDGKTLKANWVKFPREMLKARCMATAIRALCPEALDGMYTQEEVQDFAQAAPIPAQGVASPSPVAEEQDTIDYEVCPCGSVKGKRWADIPNETLEKILATTSAKAKSLTEAHRNAIIAELGKRNAVEAEVVEV